MRWRESRLYGFDGIMLPIQVLNNTETGYHEVTDLSVNRYFPVS